MSFIACIGHDWLVVIFKTLQSGSLQDAFGCKNLALFLLIVLPDWLSSSNYCSQTGSWGDVFDHKIIVVCFDCGRVSKVHKASLP
jgi:hypothetical protein